MIRRISKNNDYRDIIKSCPTGVIDDIYSIKYFISGHPETEVEASFTKKGNLLEVILPTSLLIELGNGVLMRRALYMNSDSDFPDGEYNLEFVDDLNVWLGDEEVDPPFDPGYLTEDDLKTINGDSIVGVGNIDVVNYIPSYYVTESWISSQHFASVTYVQNIISSVESGIASDLSSFATQDWVSSQHFLTSETLPSDIATQSWVLSQGYITVGDLPSGLATQSWVESYTYDKATIDVIGEKARLDALSDAQDWVTGQQFATQSWIASQRFATESFVSEKVTEVQMYASDLSYRLESVISAVDDMGSSIQDYGEQISELYSLCDEFATHTDIDNIYSYIDEQGYATEQFVTDSLSEYATQEWVSEQGYITIGDLPSGLATQSWVSSNFLSSDALTGYATEQFVTTSLSGYATESWVSSNALIHTLSSYSYLDVVERGNNYPFLIAYNRYNDNNIKAIVAIEAEEGYVSTIDLGVARYTYRDSSWVQAWYQSFATTAWVSSQGYLTSVPSGYATQSWVSSNFLAESKIWTGTFDQWILLTSAQQALYTIALIIE